MGEYIERETALKIIDNYAETVEGDDCKAIVDAVCDIVAIICPAADVEPVKHGMWNDFYGDYKVAKCSNCGMEYEVSDTGAALLMLFKAFKEYYKFCPACGAKMGDLIICPNY